MKIKRRFNELELIDIENDEYNNELKNINLPFIRYLDYKLKQKPCINCGSRLCNCSGHGWYFIDCIDEIYEFYKNNNYQIHVDEKDKYNDKFMLKLFGIVQHFQYDEYNVELLNDYLGIKTK